MDEPAGSAGLGGWATPDCNTSTYSNGKMGPNIREQASYWTTPDVCSGARDMSKIDPEAQKRPDTKRTTGLPTEVAMWATPTGSENSNRTTQIAPSHGISHGLVLAGQAASWPTPNSTDAEHSGRVNSGGGQIHLPDAGATERTNRSPSPEAAIRPTIALAAAQWPTPAARDGKGTNSVDHMNRTDGRTDGQEPCRPTAEFRHDELFAPGPADPRWGAILAAQPELAPALEPTFRGVVNGLAFDMDHSRAARLKCVGNGVVALCAAAAFVVLVKRSGVIFQ